MKKIFIFFVAIFVSLGLTSCAKNSSPTLEPSLIMTEKLVLDNKGKTILKGSNFRSGQELYVLLTTDGVQSDIGYALTPQPLPNQEGAWESEWAYGRFVKKKLVTNGNYTITVVNDDFEVLTEATFTFVK